MQKSGDKRFDWAKTIKSRHKNNLAPSEEGIDENYQ